MIFFYSVIFLLISYIILAKLSLQYNILLNYSGDNHQKNTFLYRIPLIGGSIFFSFLLIFIDIDYLIKLFLFFIYILGIFSDLKLLESPIKRLLFQFLIIGGKYFIGLSTPNMLNSKRYKEAEGLSTTATDKPHLYTTAGFHLKLNNTITLSPSMLYRMVADAPNQLTAIAKLTLKEKLSLGVGVSNNDYISTMLQFKMNQIDLGFGYEIGQRTSATALRANTSEMMLRYRF